MKAKDMREKSGADLLELQKSLTRDAFSARFKNFTNRLDDTSSLEKARRDVARVKTILAERLQIGGATPDAAEGAAPEAKAKPAKAAKAVKPAKAAKAAPKAKAAPSEKAAKKTSKAKVEASK
jgi:large subunit ribosomal protein L29